jgi:hypothetical protein
MEKLQKVPFSCRVETPCMARKSRRTRSREKESSLHARRTGPSSFFRLLNAFIKSNHPSRSLEAISLSRVFLITLRVLLTILCTVWRSFANRSDRRRVTLNFGFFKRALALHARPEYDEDRVEALCSMIPLAVAFRQQTRGEAFGT